MALCASMRHVVAGGEALAPALAARLRQRLPRAHLHNTYGPTEATIDITGGSLRVQPRSPGCICSGLRLPRLPGICRTDSVLPARLQPA